jgi:oligosaccharide repeat unit polymerase
MLLLTTLIFSVLAFVNHRLGGKALMYPPVAFCAMWAFDLFLVWAVGDFFYPMQAKTLGIFLCGGLVFSLGCWAAILLPESNPPAKPAFHPSSDRIITFLVLIVIIGVPFFCRWIFGLVSTSGGTGTFLLLARMSVIEEMGKNLTFTLFGTLTEIAFIVALMAFYERVHHPKRAVLAITVSLGMGILLGQKIGPLSLVVGMICIEWIRTRRINWKFLVVLLLIFIAATATIEFYVHLGGDSPQEKIVPIVQSFALYASGGMIGFDRVVREPNIVPGINPLYVIYQRILRRLGMYEQIPEVAEFVTIGPQSLVDNVYTMYWEYLFLGYLGAILFTGLIGFLLTLIFKRAMQGGKICIFLYAVLFRGVIFAPFTDYFLNLYFLFKVLILAWLVYSLPVRWAQFITLIGRTGPPNLVKS